MSFKAVTSFFVQSEIEVKQSRVSRKKGQSIVFVKRTFKGKNILASLGNIGEIVMKL